MKITELIILIAAILGLGAALEGFINVGFSTKLIVLAFCGVLAFWIAVRRLTDWLRVKRSTGLIINRPRRSKAKMLVGILLLGGLALCLLGTSYLVIKFYAINIETAILSNNQGGIWITASRQLASKLIVSVPPNANAFDCWPVSNHGRPAETTMLEWDTLEPHLQITNFIYPERQGVICSPTPTRDQFGFLVEPATLEVLLPDQRSRYQKLFCALGGFLWIAGIAFFILRSR